MLRSAQKISRRQFLGGGLALAGAAPFAGALSSPASTVELASISIPVSNLPEELAGFRIGFLTDIHLSAFLQSDLIENALKELKTQNLDLLLLGGDYIWRPRELVREAFPIYRKEFSDLDNPDLARGIYRQLIELVSDVKTRYGTFAVLGNHDRWAASTTCQHAFDGSPIRLLINQSFAVSHGGKILEIFGSDDYLTGRPQLPPASSRETTRILLTHNPDILPWYLDQNHLPFALALMGHTHGGQICPRRGVAFSYNIENSRYGEGLVNHFSGCACYTARGIGCVGVPFRLNCPPEVTVLTLERAVITSL